MGMEEPGELPTNNGLRTLRTCLQDYTAFNNQVQPASISLGYCSLPLLLPNSMAHLQNLVISEVLLDEGDAIDPPYDFWKEAAHNPERKKSSKIIFEGQDAHAASMAIDAPEADMLHPQLSSRQSTGPTPGSGSKPADESLGRRRAGATADEFWHHIRYDDSKGSEDDASDYPQHLRGEFWLSKRSVEKASTYFHCSSTLGQALTMCIVFRFSCPAYYLSLIENEARSVLKDTHIPTNGVALGIESDPRHDSLLRMFVDHRNEILDDIVISEVKTGELNRTIVHQEVYDGG